MLISDRRMNKLTRGNHMEQKLYDLMDWAGIEELVYSEASNPHAMLGPHLTEDGLLIQALGTHCG